jgi:molecular chaperone DnaK
VRASNGDARINAQGKEYSPPEISAMILQKLKQAADEYLGESVTKAVITVPAYFNDAQRQATKDAGQIAGLEVMRIVNEPTAAALAYGLDKKKDETIAVYDFGGGTFDISILEVGEGVVEVKATNGDTHLGGDNLDQRIIDWIITDFKKSEGIDLGKDRMALQRLRESAEKAKMELSTVMETDINLPFITADATGPKHLQMKLSRAKFEQLVEDLLQKTIGPTKQALADAGSTRRRSTRSCWSAGRRAFRRSRRSSRSCSSASRTRASTRTRSSRWARRPGRRARRRREGPAPARRHPALARHRDDGRRDDGADPAQHDHPDAKERDLLDRLGQPDERRGARAAGRAIAGARQPDAREVPSRRPAAGAAGVPQIEVTFDIDANGIVNVSAKDLGTGKEQRITITASSGLAKDEVDRMMKEAEAHAEDDRKRREEIEVRNRADQAVYGAERLLKDTGDKLGDADKRAIESAMEAVKKANEGTDAAAIQQALDQLTAAQHKAAETLYKQQAPGGPGAGGPAAADLTRARPTARAAQGRRAPAARQKATSSTRKWWTKERTETDGSLRHPGSGTGRDACRRQAGLQAPRPQVSPGHQPW